MARLSKAPVCYTLAQMRFNARLDLGDLLPRIQKALSAAGYPDFTPEETREALIRNDENGVVVQQKETTRYSFRNKTQTAEILLEPGAMTYSLSEYPVFQEFSAAFIGALRLIDEHRKIDYWDRLGMRMLDVIQPLNDESLSDYVIPQALGFQEMQTGSLKHLQTTTESLFEQGMRKLKLRTLRWHRGASAPPDLAPLRLAINSRFLDNKGDTIMLDTDCFEERRQDFDLQGAEQKLEELKSSLSTAFKSVVTEHALRAWE